MVGFFCRFVTKPAVVARGFLGSWQRYFGLVIPGYPAACGPRAMHPGQKCQGKHDNYEDDKEQGRVHVAGILQSKQAGEAQLIYDATFSLNTREEPAGAIETPYRTSATSIVRFW